MNDDSALVPDPDHSEHIPVLLEEVLDGLAIRPGMQIVDCTLGGGGHAAGLLARSAPDGRLLGLDADPAAIRRVGMRLAGEVKSGRLIMVQSPFERLQQVVTATGFGCVDAILLDLGVSSFQLETASRGFSFQHSGPLDMRFDPEQELDAATIVNEWDEQAIADLIYRYGEDRRSRRIARHIVQNRPIESTGQLASIISSAIGRRREKRIHPATRTFQALRIAVNRELDQLQETLPQCLNILRPGGRLVVISFHSLEDRIVKQWSQAEARDFVHDTHHPYGGYERTPTLRLVGRKPIFASPAELEHNPRSRSARLRTIEKI